MFRKESVYWLAVALALGAVSCRGQDNICFEESRLLFCESGGQRLVRCSNARAQYELCEEGCVNEPAPHCKGKNAGCKEACVGNQRTLCSAEGQVQHEDCGAKVCQDNQCVERACDPATYRALCVDEGRAMQVCSAAGTLTTQPCGEDELCSLIEGQKAVKCHAKDAIGQRCEPANYVRSCLMSENALLYCDPLSKSVAKRVCESGFVCGADAENKLDCVEEAYPKACEAAGFEISCQARVLQGKYKVKVAKRCVEGFEREEICVSDDLYALDCKEGVGCFQECHPSFEAQCLDDGRVLACVDGALQIQACATGACRQGQCQVDACSPQSYKATCEGQNKIKICKHGQELTMSCEDFVKGGLCQQLSSGLAHCRASSMTTACTAAENRCSEDGHFRVRCDEASKQLQTTACGEGMRCLQEEDKLYCLKPCAKEGSLECRMGIGLLPNGQPRLYAAMYRCEKGFYELLGQNVSSTCIEKDGKPTQFSCTYDATLQTSIIEKPCAEGASCAKLEEQLLCVDEHSGDTACKLDEDQPRCADDDTMQHCVRPEGAQARWNRSRCESGRKCQTLDIGNDEHLVACFDSSLSAKCERPNQLLCDGKTAQLYQCARDAKTGALFAGEVTPTPFCASDAKSIQQCSAKGELETIKSCTSGRCTYDNGNVEKPICQEPCTHHYCQNGKIVLCENYEGLIYSTRHTQRSELCYKEELLSCTEEQTVPTRKACASSELCVNAASKAFCASKCNGYQDDHCIEKELHQCQPRIGGGFYLENTHKLCEGTCFKEGELSCINQQRHKCVGGSWTENFYTNNTRCGGSCEKADQGKQRCADGFVQQCFSNGLWQGLPNNYCLSACDKSEENQYRCHEEQLYSCRKFARGYFWSKPKDGNCLLEAGSYKRLSCAGKANDEAPEKFACAADQGCYNSLDPKLGTCRKLCEDKDSLICSADRKQILECVFDDKVLPKDKGLIFEQTCSSDTTCVSGATGKAECKTACEYKGTAEDYRCVQNAQGKFELQACKREAEGDLLQKGLSSYCDGKLERSFFCNAKGDLMVEACRAADGANCREDGSLCVGPSCAFIGADVQCQGGHILSCRKDARYQGVYTQVCANPDAQCMLNSAGTPSCVVTCPDSDVTSLGQCSRKGYLLCVNRGTETEPRYEIEEHVCPAGCAYIQDLAVCVTQP